MAKKTKTTPYDAAELLTTPERRAAYLQAHIEESGGDPYWINIALSNIARAEGMTEIARKTRLSRESLYKSLSGKRNPGFATVVKVLAALGLTIQIVPR